MALDQTGEAILFWALCQHWLGSSHLIVVKSRKVSIRIVSYKADNLFKLSAHKHTDVRVLTQGPKALFYNAANTSC